MLSLPEEYELIGFFEREPELAVPDTPWCYNNLRFYLSRGEDHLLCEIEPACGELKILWRQGGLIRTSLRLNNLKSMSIHLSKDDEHMIVSDPEDNPHTLLKLRLKPCISIELECWHEFP